MEIKQHHCHFFALMPTIAEKKEVALIGSSEATAKQSIFIFLPWRREGGKII